MTLWPRHNWTLIRGQRRSTPQGTGWCAIKHATAAWKVPLKESSLHEPSSVTLRVILWTPSGPCAPWGASGPATTSPGPPSPSSSSSPGLTPLLPSLQTKSTRSIGPGSCDSQDAQDVHQRPQRLGNKEVLELVLGSRWYPQPFNAADERQSAGNETRTSWDELRRGHHNMIWERSQVFSARTKRWPERNN